MPTLPLILCVSVVLGRKINTLIVFSQTVRHQTGTSKVMILTYKIQKKALLISNCLSCTGAHVSELVHFVI